MRNAVRNAAILAMVFGLTSAVLQFTIAMGMQEMEGNAYADLRSVVGSLIVGVVGLAVATHITLLELRDADD